VGQCRKMITSGGTVPDSKSECGQCRKITVSLDSKSECGTVPENDSE
jgi:hypothetical protein